MIRIDPDLPETGRLAWLARRLNRIYEALRSLQPVNTPETNVTHSAIGTSVKTKPTGKSESGADDDNGARWA